MTIRHAFALLLGALAGSGVFAATAVVTGPRVFVVSDCAKPPAYTLRFVSDVAPLAVRSSDAARKDTQAVTPWSIEWSAPVAADPTIKEYTAEGLIKGGCPAPGAYALQVSLLFPAGAAPAPLQIEVRRPEPVLDAPAAITLEGEMPTWNDAPALRPIQIGETSTVADIDAVSAGAGQLRNATGEQAAAALTPVNTPLKIPAGKVGTLAVGLSNALPPGTYTTRISLQSPSLKQPQNIDVTVKLRLYRSYLFITIVVGVLLGWVVNVWLASRTALLTARVEALRSADVLARRASVQRDPEVQQRLVAAMVELETAIRNAEKPEQVQTAITEATALVTRIETEAGNAANALKTALQRVHAVLEPAQGPLDTMVAERIAALSAELAGIDAAAAGGDVVEAQRRLDALEQRLGAAVADALRPWLAGLHAKLRDVGPWAAPAVALEAERLRLMQEIEAAYPAAPEQLVEASHKIAAALAVFTRFTAPAAMAGSLRAAAAILQEKKNDTLAHALTDAAVDLLALGSANASPVMLLDHIAATRRRVEERMLVAKDDAAVRTQLQNGNFVGAAATIAGTQAPNAAPGPTVKEIARPASALQGAPPSAWRPRLIVPAMLPLKRPSHVQIDWGKADKAPIDWAATPAGATFQNAGMDGADVVPSQSGFLTIAASNTAMRIEAQTYAGSLGDSTDLARARSESSSIKWWIWLATAVLTSLTGYLVFANTWFGTIGEFFSAFVWGFFGQFGLDRVRETVRPTISRTLP